MKRYPLLFIILFISVTGFSRDAQSSFNYKYWINTEYPERTISNIRRITDEKGGYVKYLDKHSINLKIPAGDTALILSELKKTAFITDNMKNTSNHSESLISFKARLKTKNTLLNQLYAIFNNSGLSQTMDVEREINQIIFDIEGLKGKIRYLENRIAFAEITIYVNSQTGKPQYPRVHRSQWQWINSLGLKSLLNK
ncbi:MAG: DUF4349 domain-containing protein [Spirochaetota bacterium]|nr:DUF4349 domain-containing protein [Spirochaetota bacterium]